MTQSTRAYHSGAGTFLTADEAQAWETTKAAELADESLSYAGKGKSEKIHLIDGAAKAIKQPISRCGVWVSNKGRAVTERDDVCKKCLKGGASFSTFNQPRECQGCGRTFADSTRQDTNEALCGDCYEAAGYENAHSDGHHDADQEGPQAACPSCQDAADDAAQDAADDAAQDAEMAAAQAEEAAETSASLAPTCAVCSSSARLLRACLSCARLLCPEHAVECIDGVICDACGDAEDEAILSAQEAAVDAEIAAARPCIMCGFAHPESPRPATCAFVPSLARAVETAQAIPAPAVVWVSPDAALAAPVCASCGEPARNPLIAPGLAPLCGDPAPCWYVWNSRSVPVALAALALADGHERGLHRADADGPQDSCGLCGSEKAEAYFQAQNPPQAPVATPGEVREEPTPSLADALRVLILDPRTAAYLQAHDPMAYFQGVRALAAHDAEQEQSAADVMRSAQEAEASRERRTRARAQIRSAAASSGRR